MNAIQTITRWVKPNQDHKYMGWDEWSYEVAKANKINFIHETANISYRNTMRRSLDMFGVIIR